MDKHLHIVSFTVPYPVVHGGMVDLFHKLVAFHNAGVMIHLHCFAESNREEPELNKYCTSVHYYKRKIGLAGLSFTLPYIVSSRRSQALLNNILKDNFPVLLEGIHSTWLIKDPRLASRIVCLRLHNVEYIYYRQLHLSATSSFKKLYYKFESNLLKKYEYKIARKFSAVFTVSTVDRYIYKKRFHARNSIFVPVFTGKRSVTSQVGLGQYCLYHGNLSVAENEQAVLWLIKKVFSLLDIKLIVAGKNPSDALVRRIKSSANTSVVADPSDDTMNELITNAQCHVLPSFNRTGVKLKLIHSLYAGRHCITNKYGADGSELEGLCIKASNALAFADAVRHYYEVPFTPEDIMSRAVVLNSVFQEEDNVEQFIRKLW